MAACATRPCARLSETSTWKRRGSGVEELAGALVDELGALVDDEVAAVLDLLDLHRLRLGLDAGEDVVVERLVAGPEKQLRRHRETGVGVAATGHFRRLAQVEDPVHLHR